MKKVLCLMIATLILVSVSVVSFSAVPAPTHWYGDVDETRGIQVTDATEIQRYLASHVQFDKLELILADFDGDSEISILDATNIQMYIAKKPSKRRIDDHIYCMPEVDGVISSYSSGKAMAGVPVEFTITSSMYIGDERAYPLSYECYLLDEYYENPTLIYSGDNATFEHTFEQAGTYYLKIYVYNDFGDYSVNDMQYQVIEKPDKEPFVVGLSSKKFFYKEGEKREFVAFAHGGNGPYEYCFADDYNVIQDYSEKNTVTLEPCRDIYDYMDASLTVYVRDADGNVVSDTCVYELCPNLPA